jgi:AcrR family transcriptional regulator
MATAIRRPKRGRPPDPEGRERRREEILDAAARVFAARGFAETEVQQVADALGVGKATVYRHFPTKESLFLAALDARMAALDAAMVRIRSAPGDPLDAIRRGIRGYLAFFDARPETVELLVQERAAFRDRIRPTYFRWKDRCQEPWDRILGELRRRGVVRDVPVSRITDVVGDALYGTIFTNHFAGRRRSFDAQARDLVDLLFHGMLAPSAGVRRPRPRRRPAGDRP